jgi:hypothetical protein
MIAEGANRIEVFGRYVNPGKETAGKTGCPTRPLMIRSQELTFIHGYESGSALDVDLAGLQRQANLSDHRLPQRGGRFEHREDQEAFDAAAQGFVILDVAA